MSAIPAEQSDSPSVRSILRVVVTVVASALAVYVVYLVRQPIGWVVLAGFLAVALSAPVNVLARRMRRGFAMLLVYLAVIFTPIAIGLILVPPLVKQGVKLVDNLPKYVDDLNNAFETNPQLKKLNEQYKITDKLDKAANKLVNRLGQAASALASIGAGLVSSIFALVTILVLSAFMVGRGKAWTDAWIERRPPHQQASLRRAFDGMASAVSGYVGGAVAQALVAGFAAFLMLTILGVPSPLALAVIIAILDVIPMVGATLGAVVVGVVTAFHDFPTVTIIWTIFAIAYQQFENYVIQPRIQSHAVQLDPFVVVIAALFGGALLGVIGALLAIPAAATIQVGWKEWTFYREQMADGTSPAPPQGGA